MAKELFNGVINFLAFLCWIAFGIALPISFFEPFSIDICEKIMKSSFSLFIFLFSFYSVLNWKKDDADKEQKRE